MPPKKTGKGIFSKAAQLVTGKKPGQKDFNKLVNDHGSASIRGIVVARQEIQSAVQKLANLISLGKFEDAKKYYSYDKLFHLKCVISLSDGYSFSYEKVPAPIVSPPSTAGYETKPVPLGGRSITLETFLTKALDLMGNDFWHYEAYTTNCQAFCENLLAANGLLTPPIRDFIQQDVEKLTKELPGHLRKTTSFATDLKSAWQGITGHGLETDEALDRLKHGHVVKVRKVMVKEEEPCRMAKPAAALRLHLQATPSGDYDEALDKLKHGVKVPIEKHRQSKAKPYDLRLDEIKHADRLSCLRRPATGEGLTQSIKEMKKLIRQSNKLEGKGLQDHLKKIGTVAMQAANHPLGVMARNMVADKAEEIGHKVATKIRGKGLVPLDEFLSDTQASSMLETEAANGVDVPILASGRTVMSNDMRLRKVQGSTNTKGFSLHQVKKIQQGKGTLRLSKEHVSSLEPHQMGLKLGKREMNRFMKARQKGTGVVIDLSK